MKKDESEHSAGIAPQTTTVALEVLCRRAGDGDRAAFEALYRATVSRVYGLCLRMTSNPARAEECTQNSYVRAWRKLDGFRAESNFETWLHRIAVNEVLGMHRRERRHDQFQGKAAIDADAVIDGAAINAAAAPSAGADIDLERAISTLPERARQVFVLHAIYGYSHGETGRMLGVAEGTSKAHFHEARRQLKDSLGGSNES